MVKILGDHERRYYFSFWVSLETWGKVKVWEEHCRMESRKDSTKYKWLMQCELEQLYKDEEIVNALISAKINDPKLHRTHPELPHIKKAMQFKCLIEDSQQKTVANILKQGMRLDGEVEGEDAEMLMRKQMKLSASALGHTTYNLSSDSSSSSNMPAPGHAKVSLRRNVLRQRMRRHRTQRSLQR